jgi:type IV secretory system conjugative DNA transfer VirD4/TraG family protein
MRGTEFIIVAVIVLLVIWAIAAQSAKANRQEKQRRLRAERRRVEECGEVVLFFANHLGYIARSVISREEIGQMIDTGITASDLAAEIARRIDEAEGLVLGYHPFGEAQIDVKLPEQARERHVYIIGKSGYGKTNLLRTMIFQDLEEGKGIGVIAPEQEMLTEEILPYIPDHRIDDVIYFNPADVERAVSFNPLHLDPGEDLDLKVDEIFTIFQRLLGEAGPRMGELLRQALYALAGRPGATLLDIERLMDRSDSSFREQVIGESSDPQVIHFWGDVYPTLPKDAHLPVTTRLGRFVRPKAIRNILCNPNRSLNFGEAMDRGRILLFNLSDGILGEQNSQLLGQLVVSKFQLAVMARANQSKHERSPFYLYIDEFQTFTGTSQASYEKMLSRARKYKLSLVLAHQQTGQLPVQLLKEILGNVSTTVCFLVSREDAMKFSKELITTYNGEIGNVPEEEILRLKVGQAWCKIGQQAFLMQTCLADQRPDRRRAQYIIERSRQNYGSPVAEGYLKQPRAYTATPEAPAPQDKSQPKAKGKVSSPVDDFLKDIDPGNVFDE